MIDPLLHTSQEANSRYRNYLIRLQKTGLHRSQRALGLLQFLLVNPQDFEVENLLNELIEEEELRLTASEDYFSPCSPIGQHDLLGDLYLGKIAQRQICWQFPSALLTNSMFVCGRAGGGKTNFIILLAAQVLANNNVVIFDRKSDYIALSENNDFSYLLLEHVYFNILEPPPGVSFQQWLSILAEIISNFFDIRIAARTLITSAGLKLYEIYRNRGSELYPTLRDIYHFVKKITYPAISHHARHQETVINRLDSILTIFGDHICSHRKVNWDLLFSLSWALSLEGIPTDLQNFLITATVARILLYRMANNLRSSELETLLVFDEASTVFRRWHELREGTPLLLDYMAKAREFGIGFLIGSQTLSGMADSVLANTATKVLFGGFGLGSDYDVFAHSTGLNPEQKDQLKRRTMPGQACAKDLRYPYAFLLEVPRVV